MASLLLAAFPPELADLDSHPPKGWHVACTGVGAIQAAVSTARIVAETRPDRVLFIGTCGAYDERLKLGDIFAVSEAISTSVEELKGGAYRPESQRTGWPSTWGVPFPPRAVVVPPAITKTDEGGRLFGALAPAEHLEITGIFAACHEAKVPVAALLIVANRVGPGAQRAWQTNHVTMSRRLVETLQEMNLFSPSLPS